jgi:predicted membrane GTPase involved in stress response
MTDTRGKASSITPDGYGPFAGELDGRRRGVLVKTAKESAVAFAIGGLQDRATMS